MISFRRELGPDHEQVARPLSEYLDHQLQGQAGRNLTQVIEKANEPLAASRARPEDLRQDGQPRIPAGFPWVTPVLGTGIVNIGLKERGSILAARIDGFATTLQGLPAVGEAGSPAAIAQGFVEALAVQRLGADWGPESQPSPTESPGAARLALAVALLTRLHHLAAGFVGGPTPRWDDEHRPVLPHLGPTQLDQVEPILESAQRQLTWFKHDGERTLESPVLKLVEAADAALHEERLPSHAELRLLTECVWYETTKGCLTYPGWSDLMLGLAMEYPPPIAHQDGWARPPYRVVSNIENAGIIGRYKHAAKDSWSARFEQTDRPSTLHDLFAAVLQAQAKLWNRNEGPWTVPRASAFVTGFDLELELALLAAGQPFVLALPAFIEESVGATETSILWFYRRIEPTEESDAELPMFTMGAWRALGGAAEATQLPAQADELPVVVRLTGCPGVSIPDLSDPDLLGDVSRLLGDKDWANMAIRPAYVLDEFIAGALGATETFLDHLDTARLGLPKRITGVPGGVNAMFARFWLAVGVQISDSTVRHRLISQLTAPQLASAQPKSRSRTTGLLVNRRLGPLDARTMRWLGFDVVADEGAQLISHLAHYLQHLQAPEDRCSRDGGCKVGGAARG